MPVLVTAADSAFGAALTRRLLATGGQVRAWCSGEGDVGALRRRGAIVATGDVDDTGRLEAACEQVHTVIHLGGGLLSPSAERIVHDASSVVEASANAGVRRLIVVSILGARADAADALRRAKAQVEAMTAASTVPSVVLRVPLITTGQLAQVLVGTPLAPALREHEVRTIEPASLVEMLWSLDELRSNADTGHVLFTANGRRSTTLGDVIGDLDGSTGTYRPLEQLPLLADGLLGPWQDDDPVALDAWEFTGIDVGATP